MRGRMRHMSVIVIEPAPMEVKLTRKPTTSPALKLRD